MLRHKNINKICWAALSLVVVIAIVFATCASLGLIEADSSVGYENRLFNTSRVHTIDIVMDDWDSFIETATSEEYSSCTIIVDGENTPMWGSEPKEKPHSLRWRPMATTGIVLRSSSTNTAPEAAIMVWINSASTISYRTTPI